MRILFTSLLLLWFISPIAAQHQSRRNQLKMVEFLMVENKSKVKIPDNVEGSPYLSPFFQQGKIYIAGNDEPVAALLRLNAFEGNFEVKDGSGKITPLKRERALSFRVLNQLYELKDFTEKGKSVTDYVEKLNPNGKSSLYLRKLVSLIPEQPAMTSYDKTKPPRFKTETFYYMSIDGGNLFPVKLKKKDVLAALSDKK